MVPRSVSHELLVQAQQIVPRNQTVSCWTEPTGLGRQGPELVEICKSFESVTHHDVSKYDCRETTSTCFCMCVSDLFQHFVHIQHCVGAGESSITLAPTVCIRTPAETQQHAYWFFVVLVNAHAVVVLLLRLALAGRQPQETRRFFILVAL